MKPTIETLHLGLLSVLALLQSLGVAPLFAVEHEAQHDDDVGHGRPHRQADGLDHLVRSLVAVFIVRLHWFVCRGRRVSGCGRQRVGAFLLRMHQWWGYGLAQGNISGCSFVI